MFLAIKMFGAVVMENVVSVKIVSVMEIRKVKDVTNAKLDTLIIFSQIVQNVPQDIIIRKELAPVAQLRIGVTETEIVILTEIVYVLDILQEKDAILVPKDIKV